jgi:hypothetical protein
MKPAPLALKPDLDEASRRWEAFYAGDVLERPVVCVTAPLPGAPRPPAPSYHERVHLDLDALVARELERAEGTFWGGEAVPAMCPSFGPDEVAVFCGAPLEWSSDSGDTNWSIPLIDDWRSRKPIAIDTGHPLWIRMLEYYRRAAAGLGGRVLRAPLDLHTNMDLLAALRGPQRLCMDLLDCPSEVDGAMAEARAVFRMLWEEVARAGLMREEGFCHAYYSMEGAAVLQCDFSCMMSPAMFNRWVMPALEEEARIVRHAIYHWDGPGALVHFDALVASPGLHSLSYVPGAGRGTHRDYLDLFKRIQAAGKAVQIWGDPEELKEIHRDLDPALAFYCTAAWSRDEAERLLEWFRRNT